MFLFLVRQVDLIIRVGKKRAIYIPKNIAEELGIEEGDKMILEVVSSKIVLTPIKTKSKQEFWGEASEEEVEEAGEEITRRVIEGR